MRFAILALLAFTACATVPKPAPGVLWKSDVPGVACFAVEAQPVPARVGVYTLQGGELTPVTEMTQGAFYYVGLPQ